MIERYFNVWLKKKKPLESYSMAIKILTELVGPFCIFSEKGQLFIFMTFKYIFVNTICGITFFSEF